MCLGHLISVCRPLWGSDGVVLLRFYSAILSETITPKRPFLLHLQAVFAFLTLSKVCSVPVHSFSFCVYMSGVLLESCLCSEGILQPGQTSMVQARASARLQ